MRSVTVDVDVIWKKDGVIVPIALYWPMDANGSVERYGIDEAVPTTSQNIMTIRIIASHTASRLMDRKDG